MQETYILYVDDEEVNLLMFEMIFKDHFNIFTARSPGEAIEIIKEKKITVVITDYKMPNMNGLELIREIKKLSPETVCIILSGYFNENVAASKDILYCYMAKPWNKAQLISTVEKAIENSRQS
jgi:YesN/AraC family two-component response regulator